MKELKIDGIVAMKTNDQPKIILGAEMMGSHQVTFELYNIDPSSLMALVGKQLKITFEIE